MSVRAVWIFGGEDVLFSRRYPTVERRAKLLAKDRYFPLPSDHEWFDAVLTECREAQQDDEFLEERDSSERPCRKPVYELYNGKYWPVIVLEQYGFLFCCLPLVDCKEMESRVLVEIPGISIGFDLLEKMADFIGPQSGVTDSTSPKLRDLYNYLCLAAPFGSPVQTNPDTVKSILQTRLQPWTLKQKQPTWKPFLYKGNPRLQFQIKEEMKAVQYDSKMAPDVWEVSGTITCKAELEGLPEVSISIAVPPDAPPIDYVVTHPCVQSADTTETDAAGGDEEEEEEEEEASRVSAALKTRKFKFLPPLETFVLCQYVGPAVASLPIRGYYQMKGDKMVKFLVQLKLSERVKNQFEFCEVRIPFFNRGIITNAEVSPTNANVVTSPDKKSMIWNAGQKFPSKSLEMSLNATVHFGEPSAVQKAESVPDDPFCVGLNAYVEVHFKIPEFTLTGCLIDSKSLSLYPNVKAKLTSNREFSSMSYRIWNSHGDALMALPQSQLTGI